jgi:hypothetical protein
MVEYVISDSTDFTDREALKDIGGIWYAQYGER